LKETDCPACAAGRREGEEKSVKPLTVKPLKAEKLKVKPLKVERLKVKAQKVEKLKVKPLKVERRPNHLCEEAGEPLYHERRLPHLAVWRVWGGPVD